MQRWPFKSLLVDWRRMMERWINVPLHYSRIFKEWWLDAENPGWYSKIDKGRWKDSEMNFEDILGSIKDDGKMHKRSTAIFKDRRRKMERWWKDPWRYSRIDQGRWKDEEKFHGVILGSTKADGKMKKCSTSLF